MWKSLLIVVCALGLAACRTTAPVIVQPPPAPPPPPAYGLAATDLNALLGEQFDETRSVDVLYVTNRNKENSRGGCEDGAYGVDVIKDFSFGRCRLNVPKNHAVGSIIEADSPRDDPNSFYRVLGHQGLPRESLVAALADSTEPDLLVLVHGFNVQFEDAVLRTAQIAYDLKFQGPVVLFSWPAGAGDGVLNRAFISRTYNRNQENAEASIEPAAAFFELLAETGKTVHVGVHSMGHQVIVPALVGAIRRVGRPFLGEIILNAPDMPIEQFRDAAPSLIAAARRVTVYCSYNDNAIAASEAFNDGRRLGACEQIDGVDVINVGEIDAPALGVGGLGHGYYASRPILTDVFQVLLGIQAERRLFIRRSEPNSTENYYLRP